MYHIVLTKYLRPNHEKPGDVCHDIVLTKHIDLPYIPQLKSYIYSSDLISPFCVQELIFDIDSNVIIAKNIDYISTKTIEEIAQEYKQDGWTIEKQIILSKH